MQENDIILEITRKLISLRPDTHERINQAMDFCAEWFRQNDIHVKRFENNGLHMLAATSDRNSRRGRNGENNGDHIILHSHLDVVPAQDNQFSPVLRGDKLFGRGSLDMLGATAVMMTVLKGLKTAPSRHKVTMLMVPDEEKGGEFGTPFLIRQGFTGDFVICGEPTNLNLAIQAKGVLHLEIKIQGVTAHGSRPWLGENAIEKAFSIYQEIAHLPFTRASTPIYSSPSVNLSTISGGDQLNQVPGSCTMGLDIRFLPGQDPEMILREIKEISSQLQLNVLCLGEPVTNKPENHYIRSLADSIRRKTQKEPACFGQDGSADNRFFAASGIPAVEFGPVGEGHHGEREYVKVSSLHLYKSILKDFLGIE